MTKRPILSQRYVGPHTYPEGVAWLDGQYVPISEAKVSVLDWGFLHSDATYDTVHVRQGRFFRLDKHLDRFAESMARLRMSLPLGREEIRDILHNCAALSGHENAYVEMICTRGTSPTFSRDPRDAVNRFIAFAVPYGSVANSKQMERGLRVTLTDVVRIPPSSVDPHVKNYHWLDLVRGLYDAYDSGAETALLRDAQGNVAEGPGFNVFIVKDGALASPAEGVLAGITRTSVIELCAELGLNCALRSVSEVELRAADEVFVTSTAGGVMPVTMVDGTPVGNGSVGPVMTAIKTAYWAKHEDPNWSELVTLRTEP